ncbi:LacI family DNA-binding transcriptional regulator [Goodfellowiella coeruleoviolacea]|uniref:Transcriptional regulator, LacI family n=1 Tax=Goodfellowiella coeruleoviolacea TaxID=334858 RepID=A0AAE3GB81_9PSEU|nr:transcriptional regulator, LacI family [Goodfellowiella coeruleoviolacea]
MSVTIRDVAHKANVSVSTVSRALSAPNLVRQQTRDRVIAAADELGYRPNTAARSLITGKTGILGIVVTDLGNPFYTGILKGVQARARQDAYSVLFADGEEDPATEESLVRTMAKQVDGLVVCAPTMSDQQLRDLAELTPMVLVNRHVPEIPAVLMDSAGGMRQVVDHLAALGHERIAYLGGPRGAWSDQERRAGLLAAAERQHIGVAEFGPFPPRFDGGIQGADLALAAEVTAIVAYNDLMAFGTLSRLRSRGVRVPTDVSVVGFDDLVFSATSAPPLTTVAMPTEAAGRAAVHLLLARLAESGAGAPATAQRLDTYLIVRFTTSPPGAPVSVSAHH